MATENAAKPDLTDQAALQEAAGWIAGSESGDTEYRYVMTCRVRLLLFWAGRDDVGGGYVRIGKSSGDARQQMIQVLFGSDPAKAPLSINRWGAGTEVLRLGDSGQPVSSAFFGFMKSSQGQSVRAMQKEISNEKNGGDHRFDGIISRVDKDRAISTSLPYASKADFDFREYGEAEKATLQQLRDNPARHVRRLQGEQRRACPRVGEFLSTVLQLIGDGLAGHSTPEALCYIYNARRYRATLLGVHPLAQKSVHVTRRGSGRPIDQNYRHLMETHFEILNEETSVTTPFDIVVGTEGKLRGAPLQITYQPKWWFQIVLNLAPDAPNRPAPAGH
jgi:hypothetical protein